MFCSLFVADFVIIEGVIISFKCSEFGYGFFVSYLRELAWG